jgi:hypothetical protein
MTGSATRNVVFFIALLATAIALGGALAHLFELPNKFDLPREPYFIVQQIYAGWWQFAYALAVQLIAIIALLFLYRHQTHTFLAVFVALLCLIAAQILFWIYTQPANAATNNWTTQPGNWEALRRHWEYSHAGGAVFQLLAFCALVVAVLRRGA